VAALSAADGMFAGAHLSTANYDALLAGWGAQSLQTGVQFHGGNSTYCTAEAARQHMIAEHGWTITDAGLACQTRAFLPLVEKHSTGALHGEAPRAVPSSR